MKWARGRRTGVLWDSTHCSMTIAISLKVNDGVVLASDSATTLIAVDGGAPSVVNVYYNANKVFNLYKGCPVGAITWGAGSIGNASISTLFKDFRKSLHSPADGMDPNNYRVGDVADRLRTFMYDGQYLPNTNSKWPEKPALGFVVAGYSTGGSSAEEYRIDIGADGKCVGPTPLRGSSSDACGVSWNGEPEAITRLILGFAPALSQLLQKTLGLDPKALSELMRTLRSMTEIPLVPPPMPIQDAIELAEFLVTTTIGLSRFSPGAQTVGGPVEIAVITKHEGFKWIRRKHYFSTELNPLDRP